MEEGRKQGTISQEIVGTTKLVSNPFSVPYLPLFSSPSSEGKNASLYLIFAKSVDCFFS